MWGRLHTELDEDRCQRRCPTWRSRMASSGAGRARLGRLAAFVAPMLPAKSRRCNAPLPGDTLRTSGSAFSAHLLLGRPVALAPQTGSTPTAASRFKCWLQCCGRCLSPGRIRMGDAARALAGGLGRRVAATIVAAEAFLGGPAAAAALCPRRPCLRMDLLRTAGVGASETCLGECGGPCAGGAARAAAADANVGEGGPSPPPCSFASPVVSRPMVPALCRPPGSDLGSSISRSGLQDLTFGGGAPAELRWTSRRPSQRGERKVASAKGGRRTWTVRLL